MSEESSYERRKHRRVPVTLPVKVYVTGKRKAVEAEIRNVSEGGALIKCETRIEKGQNVLIELPGRNIEEALIKGRIFQYDLSQTQTSESVVRWIGKEGESFGVEFIDLGPELKKLILAIIEEADKRSS